MALRAARHPKAFSFRESLCKRITCMARILKDVIELQYPWALFALPPYSSGKHHATSSGNAVCGTMNKSGITCPSETHPTGGCVDPKTYGSRPAPSTAAIPCPFGEETSLNPLYDPVGWRSETIPMVVPDVVGFIQLLLGFNPRLLFMYVTFPSCIKDT